MDEKLARPFMVKQAHPKSKYEATCPKCGWCYFKWTMEEAMEKLEEHLQSEHGGEIA